MDDPRLVALGLTTPAQPQAEPEAPAEEPAPQPPQVAPPTSADWQFPPAPADQQPQQSVPSVFQFPPAQPQSAPAAAQPQGAPAKRQPQMPAIFQFPPAAPGRTAPPAAPVVEPTAPVAASPFVAAPVAPVAKPAKREKAPKAEKPAKPAKPEKPPKAEKAQKPEQPEKPARRSLFGRRAPAETPVAAATAAPIAPAAPVIPAATIAPVAAPVVLAPVGPSRNDELLKAVTGTQGVVKRDVQIGVVGRARLELAPTGFALITRSRGKAYAWSEVQEIAARAGRVHVRVEAERDRVTRTKDGPVAGTYVEKMTYAVMPMLDGVSEPGIAPQLAHVLQDMKEAKFSYTSTSWLQLENAQERMRDEFAHHDDAFTPAVAGGLWIALGLASLLIVPELVNLATDIDPPTGTFVIEPRYPSLDPRTILVSFALSAIITRFVIALGLGSGSLVWARGTVRGWHTKGSRALRIFARIVARALLARRAALMIVLLGLLAYIPTFASTIVVSGRGTSEILPLPVVGIQRPWADVVRVVKIPDSSRLEGFGVAIVFADGRWVTTVDHDLAGGTDGQFFQRATGWYDLSRD